MKEYYVYIHYLVDNKEIFYVGKGTGKRAWSKSSRSLEWKEKTKNAYNVWIIKTFHSEEEAFQEEIRLIDFFKNDPTFNLVNKQAGGKGGNNWDCLSEKQKAKEIERRKQWWADRTEEERRKISKERSLRVRGENNPQYGRPGFNTGRKFPDSHKEKISNGLKKYKRTAEHSQNLQKQIEKSCGRKIKIILSEKELDFVSIQSASRETGIPYTAIYDTLNRKSNYSPKYNFYAFYMD